MQLTYTQSDREKLLAGLLDLNLSVFLEGHVPDEITESDAVNVLGGNYVDAMMADNEDSGQLMFQAVAMMSDHTLHRLVTMFGPNPLDFDPPRF